MQHVMALWLRLIAFTRNIRHGDSIKGIYFASSTPKNTNDRM